MDLLHSVLFTIKIGLEFSLFGATRLAVSKIYPGVVGSRRKICEMLPLLSPSILYHHILTLSRIQKNCESALWTSWHPGYGEKTFVDIPPLTQPTQVSNLFFVGRGAQIYKKLTINGVTMWVDAAKSGKNNNLLVIMCVRLLHNIGLIDLTNQTRFKKGNGNKICTNNMDNYWEIFLMLPMWYIYYWQKNVDILGCGFWCHQPERNKIYGILAEHEN